MGKNIFLYFIFSLFVFLLFEVCFIGFYYVTDKEYLTVTEKLSKEDNNYLKGITKNLKCSYSATLTKHPFLAFVHHSNPPCHYPGINKSGFYGKNFPLEKNNDVFTILLLGGSVATQVGRLEKESLEKKLNEKYTADGKPFVVLNAAIKAWKQPQQLFTLMLYGDIADGIISLEGYNELQMGSGCGRERL